MNDKKNDGAFEYSSAFLVGDEGEKNNKVMEELVQVLIDNDCEIDHCIALLIGSIHAVVEQAPHTLDKFSCCVGNYVFTMEEDLKFADDLRVKARVQNELEKGIKKKGKQ